MCSEKKSPGIKGPKKMLGHYGSSAHWANFFESQSSVVRKDEWLVLDGMGCSFGGGLKRNETDETRHPFHKSGLTPIPFLKIPRQAPDINPPPKYPPPNNTPPK